MAAPTIMAALGVSALEAWRVYQPRSPLFVTPLVRSLADAIAIDDALGAYEFIRAGQDPNDRIEVRHTVLTGGRSIRVSPLLWAAALGNDQTLSMLLGFGARIDAPTRRRAMCLAEQLGHDDVARVLTPHGRPSSPEPCPKPQADGAALLGALAEPE